MRIDTSPLAQPETPLYEMKRAQDTRMAGSIAVYKPGAFTFSDLVDVVNPLQHLPFVSSVYRQATGDTISPAADVMGGAVYGGPVGAAASAISRTISDDIAVRHNPSLALHEPHTKDDISVVIDDAINSLEGTTIAHANLSGTQKPNYLHNTRRYNE